MLMSTAEHGDLNLLQTRARPSKTSRSHIPGGEPWPGGFSEPMSAGHLGGGRQEHGSPSVSTSFVRSLPSVCPSSLANYHRFPLSTFCSFLEQFLSPGFLSLLASESDDLLAEGCSKMRLLGRQSSNCPTAPCPAAASCFFCPLESCRRTSRGNRGVQGRCWSCPRVRHP